MRNPATSTVPILTALTVTTALLCARSVAAAPGRTSVDPHAGESKAHRDARMKWWRQARFGMFIHWGLYAVPAGTYDAKRTGGAGEWIMHDMKIPVAPYAAFAPQFDPEQFNADQWVSIAKSAGMKYIVMTAKHHEGFAMFHTHVDGYNIWDATPFKRDPIAEMTVACKRQGIKFGVYYSQNLDWHHPGGGTAGPAWDPAQEGDFDAYVRNVSAPQVNELITRYHPAILWWDIPGNFTPEEIRLLTASFSKDPELIYNNRLGGGVPGDTETPEQFIPPTGFPGRDWETCMTINDTWGYKSFDTDFKSSETLIHNLIDIASKGGNYLLNVGPTGQGIIPPPEVQRLQQMGAWLQHNGRSIYGTTASPYHRLPFNGRATVRGSSLFLNVFSWPAEGLTLRGLQTPVRNVRVLATGEKLTATPGADGSLTISRPAVLDPVSTAIELRLSGPPVVVEPEYTIQPRADGSYHLTATNATLEGGGIRVEGDSTPNLGYWTDAGDRAHWRVTVPPAAAGAYQATLDYSCEPGSEGSTFRVELDGAPAGITGAIAATASWRDYRTMSLDGALNLPAGTHTIRIAPETKPGLAVMNLRQITLTREPR